MKNIKKMLVLMLVTSFTFLASCSKDDNTEDNVALGDFKAKVDEKDFELNNSVISVTEGQVNQDTGKREDYLYIRARDSKSSTIRIYMNKLTDAKSYTTNNDNYITFYEGGSTVVVKSNTSSSYFSTKNHSKSSTIEVLDYDKTNNRIKIKFNAVLANSEGETKTINAIFFKEFTKNDDK